MYHVFGLIVDCWRVEGFTYTNGFNLMASIGLETKLLIISEMASRAQSSNITLAPRKDPSSLKSMIREYISSPMIRKGGVIRK